MKDEIMKFPSELIQKELAKDPAKLLNSLNNVKEIPSKKNNNIEQNTEEEKKDEKNMLSIISNSKEKIYSKQEIDSVEKNKNDINTNLNFFNIKNFKENINNGGSINNINKNNIFVNNCNNNANRIENPLSKNCEIKSNNGNINELSNSEMNHYNMIYVNKNNFMNCMNNESILGYILAQNKTINGYKILFLNNINIILTYLKTYKGSIIIQELFDKVNDNELATLFYNLIPHIPYIMCLEYGNYFFQKFIKKLNLKQRLAIYEIIEPNFI